MTPAIDINEAILLWLGSRKTAWPSTDDEAIEKAYGPERLQEILGNLNIIMEEFYRSDARFRASSLSEMGRLACADFKANNPGISDEAVFELARHYTYDYK
jgi:hypothetical protein